MSTIFPIVFVNYFRHRPSLVLFSSSALPPLVLLLSSVRPPLVLRSSSSRPTLVLLSSPLLSPCVNILAACAGDPARVGKKYDLDTPNVLEMKPWGHQSLPKSTIWEAPGATWSTLGALGAPLATLGASWGRPWDHTWPKTGAKRSQKDAPDRPNDPKPTPSQGKIGAERVNKRTPVIETLADRFSSDFRVVPGTSDP